MVRKQYHVLLHFDFCSLCFEKTLTDKKYKFKDFLDWQEAIASYVISEFTNRDVSSEL